MVVRSRKFNDIEYFVPDIGSAIKSLRPTVRKWDVSGQFIVDWVDDEGTEPPSYEEIRLELARQIETFEFYKYERERAEAYPTLGDQLDMLWHAMESGEIPKATKWFEKIQEVKKSIPKPEDPIS